MMREDAYMQSQLRLLRGLTAFRSSPGRVLSQ